MKYCKPDLHFLSAANAAAHCVDGSTPGGGHVCGTGIDVAVESCNPLGSAAHSGCRSGTGADAVCNGGTGIGIDCVSGTNDA